MITITQMRYALALQQLGSFQKAARASFVTQPTLSMQIQKLEDSLDLKLFDRSRKPVCPTLDGQKVLAQFQSVLLELAKVDPLLAELKGEIAGSYRLGVIPTVAPGIVPSLLQRMQHLYPKVRLIIEELTTSSIVEKLKISEIDAGLLAIPLGEKSLNETALYQEPMCLYQAKDLDLGGEPLARLGDIDMSRIIVLGEGHCLRTQVLDLCELGEKFEESGFSLKAGSVETLIKTVDLTKSFSIVPWLCVRDLDLRKRKTQVKRFREPEPFREIGLITHRAQVKIAIDKVVTRIIKSTIPMEELTIDSARGVLLRPY